MAGILPTPFLERLDAEARDLLLSVARQVSFMQGSQLVRHGDPARGAWLLREGSAEAVVTLPGGDSLSVAQLGAGGVFGEMALIDHGTCTATVVAKGNVDGWFVERDDFRALVASRDAAGGGAWADDRVVSVNIGVNLLGERRRLSHPIHNFFVRD